MKVSKFFFLIFLIITPSLLAMNSNVIKIISANQTASDEDILAAYNRAVAIKTRLYCLKHDDYITASPKVCLMCMGNVHDLVAHVRNNHVIHYQIPITSNYLLYQRNNE